MLKAHLVHRRASACPVCRSTEFDTRRREPSPNPGHVLNKCGCRRCGSEFVIEEDKRGRPVAK